jgi:hypothetical protein
VARQADGTKELLNRAVVTPRTHSTFTKTKQSTAARPKNTVNLDTYKARAWALRVRQKSRGR